MLKKVKKMFLLFGVLLFILICVGCNQPTVKVNNVSASYIGTYFLDEEAFLGQYYFIEKQSDLMDLLNETAPEKYDSVYFKKHSLLAFKIIESSQGNKSKIESYIIDGNVLSIHIETFQFGEDCAEGHWWFILELNIEEMKNVEFVKINKENVEIISGSKNKEMWHFKSISFLSLNFNASFNGLKGDEQIIGIFNTEKEIIDIFSKYDISWLDAPFWDEFSDDFFDNNAIVVYFSWFKGGNVERLIKSIYLKDDKIAINVSQKLNETIEDIDVFYPIVLQVNKDEIQNIKGVLLEIN